MTELTIGGLARAVGVRVDTIRYYEKRGLLKPSGRTDAGYRLYGPEALRRMRFIKQAKRLGFTLVEIGELLAFGTSEDADAGDVLAVTEKKIAEHHAKITELESLRTTLTALADECPGEGPLSECPIIDYLYPDDGGEAAALEEARR